MYPSPAKWACMKEMGRTRYIVTRTAEAMGTIFGCQIIGAFFAGATVHTVSWGGLAAANLVLAPFVFLYQRHIWNQCELSECLRTPTRYTPRLD